MTTKGGTVELPLEDYNKMRDELLKLREKKTFKVFINKYNPSDGWNVQTGYYGREAIIADLNSRLEAVKKLKSPLRKLYVAAKNSFICRSLLREQIEAIKEVEEAI